MDAETERVIGRLREICRRGKHFAIRVGDSVVRLDLPARCEIRLSADGPVELILLDNQGKPVKNVGVGE